MKSSALARLLGAALLSACAALATAAGGCDRAAAEEQAKNMTGGDPVRGEQAIAQYGCASCHTIPGIRGPNALVGPPLDRMGARTYVGGVLRNTPENMVHWIQDPPSHSPRTAMPNLHVTDEDARDIACYLYTLR